MFNVWVWYVRDCCFIMFCLGMLLNLIVLYGLLCGLDVIMVEENLGFYRLGELSLIEVECC